MRHERINLSVVVPALMALSMAVFSGCGKDAATSVAGGVDNSGTVNEYFNELPGWDVPSTAMDPPRSLDDENAFEDSEFFKCEVVEYDYKKNFDNLIAVGANANVLLPGMLVQGRGVKDGSLTALSLRRSPLDISINLAIENPSRHIDNPTSNTLNDAVASLKREADTRITDNPDLIPAQVVFVTEEAYSFEQAMMSAGISVKYSALFASGEVNSAFSGSSSVKSHTVIVRLYQPMYTIFFADDGIQAPADFFDPTLDAEDFATQEKLGNIGPGNLPCYVQSVTYGRMFLYTLTSTEATSAEELKVAVNASYGVWSGSGNYNDRQKSLVQNSTIRVQAFGGTQQQTLDAIRNILASGDYGDILNAVPAGAAVPLSYKIAYAKTRETAIIGDATKYVTRVCTPATKLRFTMTMEKVEIANGCDAFEYVDPEIYVWAHGPGVDHFNFFWHNTNGGLGVALNDLASIYPRTDIFTIDATLATEIEFSWTEFRIGMGQDRVFTYPFDDFRSGDYQFSIIDTGQDAQYNLCSLEFFFRVKMELEP